MKCRDCPKAVPMKGRHGARPSRCVACQTIYRDRLLVERVEKKLATEPRRMFFTEKERRNFEKNVRFAQTYGASPSKIVKMLKDKYGPEQPPTEPGERWK